MNVMLKYLVVAGVVLALVLTVGATIGMSIIHHRDLCTTRVDTANSVSGVGELNRQITSKPTSNFCYQQGCGNKVMFCDIVKMFENTPCPLNADQECKLNGKTPW